MQSGQVSSNSAPPAVSAAPPATPYAAPPVSTGGGSAMKILMVILGIFLLLGILVMGTCAYGAYRIKKKVNEVAGDVKVRPYHGKKDPCALVTMKEVGEALGQSVTGMEAEGSSSCVYSFGDDQRVAVETTWEGGAMTMALTHGAMKQVSGMETFTKIEGLGDEAYVAPMGSAVMMRKGDVMVNIDLRQGGLNAEGAKQIARKIAGRL